MIDDDFDKASRPKQIQFWRVGRGDPAAIGKQAIAYANALRMKRRARAKLMLLWAQMYADGPTLGLGPYGYMSHDPRGAVLRMNLVKAVVDAYVTQVVQSSPKPMVLTNGGDWSLRRKSKGMGKWWDAKSSEADWRHTVDTPCTRDSAVFGTAFVKVGIENENDEKNADVFSERVFPFEFLTDDTECQNPAHMRTCGHEKWYDRHRLAEMFPSKRRQIIASQRSSGDLELATWEHAAAATSDLIQVTELWHLPSTASSDDGMRVLVLPSGELLAPVERWTETRFPIFPMWRSHPSMGVWGQSIPWELRGIQLQINETLEDIQEALRTIGRPKWMVPYGTEMVDDVIDDEIGTIMRYAGTNPPTVYAPSVIPPEQFKLLWDLWSKGFEIIGTAAAGSAGNIPAGLSGSGASIRAWNDVQGGRLYEANELRENFHVEWGRRAFACGKRVAEIRPDYASNYRKHPRSRIVEVVKFKDVAIDDYDVGIYPASRLSLYPGQRLAQVDELFEKGVVEDRKEYRALIDFPDLQGENDLMNAPRELADMLIERFVDAEDPENPKVYVQPDPDWDLVYLRERFSYAIVRNYIDECPEANLKLLRDFKNACDYWIERSKEQAPPPEPQMMGGMVPPEAQPPMPADAGMGIPPMIGNA